MQITGYCLEASSERGSYLESFRTDKKAQPWNKNTELQSYVSALSHNVQNARFQK